MNEKEKRDEERADNLERFFYQIMNDINAIKEIIKEQKEITLLKAG
jgi:hypothetical protein